jgi:hypothetical protein
MLHKITVIHCIDAAFLLLITNALILPVGGSASNSLSVVSFRFHDKCFLKYASSSLFDVLIL